MHRDASSPVIDLDTTVTMLKSAAPDWEWMLKHIESKRGEFRFPAQVTDFIQRFKIENYPLYYKSEEAIAYAAMKGLISDDTEIREFCDRMNAATPDERGQTFAEDLFCGAPGANQAGRKPAGQRGY